MNGEEKMLKHGGKNSWIELRNIITRDELAFVMKELLEERLFEDSEKEKIRRN